MKIVLASESLSRRRAMDLLGLSYEVHPSGIDEKAIREPDASRLVGKLAEEKARNVGATFRDAIIVAGDAVVSKHGIIYEKPVDLAEASRFLTEFSGHTVEFVSAVSVLNAATGKLLTAVQRSSIAFRELRGSEIEDYIRRYEVHRFAGAFDGDGVIRFARHVSGSYNFATGLALDDLVSMLREQGVEL